MKARRPRKKPSKPAVASPPAPVAAPRNPLELAAFRLFDKPAGTRRLAAVKEAVVYSQMSRSRLYLLMRARQIAGFKDGVRTMIDLNSVDKYLDSLPAIETANHEGNIK